MKGLEERLKELINEKSLIKINTEITESLTWYISSYEVFQKRFVATRGDFSEETWIERTAYVYSWLPRIPLSSKFGKNQLEEDGKLNKCLTCAIKTLVTFELELSLNYLQSIKEINFEKNKIDEKMEEAFEAAGILLHQDYNKDTQLASITKLLHFMLPDIFPIFDRNVSIALFGNPNLNFNKYKKYLSALHVFLNSSENAELIKEFEIHPRSIIYYIDRILFDKGKEIKSETKM